MEWVKDFVAAIVLIAFTLYFFNLSISINTPPSFPDLDDYLPDIPEMQDLKKLNPFKNIKSNKQVARELG